MISNFDHVFLHRRPRRDGLVVSVTASYAVGLGSACRPGNTKDQYNGTICLPVWHEGFREVVWQHNPTVLKVGYCEEL